ncbi:hypothetical protein BJ508DRAFT_301964 [Ascobolus immersus RN42]|uniref:Uncharacterized protein n=1 Tax=Ascobolus immersus RN42 TaxID=1160509 RepID=A0A3N4ILP0_ASCIM|nr:hypothetical protein BJ508DRAFT_301964 [Ascobolus immersus RN42]
MDISRELFNLQQLKDGGAEGRELMNAGKSTLHNILTALELHNLHEVLDLRKLHILYSDPEATCTFLTPASYLSAFNENVIFNGWEAEIAETFRSSVPAFARLEVLLNIVIFITRVYLSAHPVASYIRPRKCHHKDILKFVKQFVRGLAGVIDPYRIIFWGTGVPHKMAKFNQRCEAGLARDIQRNLVNEWIDLITLRFRRSVMVVCAFDMPWPDENGRTWGLNLELQMQNDNLLAVYVNRYLTDSYSLKPMLFEMLTREYGLMLHFLLGLRSESIEARIWRHLKAE